MKTIDIQPKLVTIFDDPEYCKNIGGGCKFLNCFRNHITCLIFDDVNFYFGDEHKKSPECKKAWSRAKGLDGMDFSNELTAKEVCDKCGFSRITSLSFPTMASLNDCPECLARDSMVEQ